MARGVPAQFESPAVSLAELVRVGFMPRSRTAGASRNSRDVWVSLADLSWFI
jgi:hypothetical protein